MSLPYTPEPWVAERDSLPLRALSSLDGYPVITGHGKPGGEYWERNNEAQGNLYRALACVNACKGLNPSEVPGMAAEIMRLKEERSVMVEALQRAASVLLAGAGKRGRDWDIELGKVYESVSAALTLAEGGDQ